MVGGYVYTKRTIEYRPNQTPFKKADKLDLLGTATDSHGIVIPIAILDIPREASATSYRQQYLLQFFETLRRHGFKFTTYEEK
jgi:hypothetical protein